MPKFETILSFITSLSAVSVILIIPYTIGYFSFYDTNLLPLFSVVDYYWFSALPLVWGVFLLLLYFGIAAFLRNAQLEMRTMLLVTLIGATAFVTLLYLITHAVIIAIFWLTLLCIPTILYYHLSSGSQSGLLAMGLIGILLIGNLAALGYVSAGHQFLKQELVEVTFVDGDKKTNYAGALIFLGGAALSFIDDQGFVKAVRTDKNVTLQFGRSSKIREMMCIEWRPVQWIRLHVFSQDRCFRSLVPGYG